MYDRRMGSASSDITAFILAGGRSTRMGMEKAFVLLEGRTLLARMLDVARTVTAEVRIVGSPAKFRPFAPVVEDVFPGCGPLSGIHAALRSSQTDLNLILAVDVPFVSFALLQFLITRSSESAAVVTVTRTSGGLQPLCAVYRKTFADLAEKALHERRYKIDALFDDGLTEVITEEELRVAGFSPELFRNLNTPDDVAGAINEG